MANPIRVSAALNAAPLNAYRITALVLCLLVTVVDGLDFVAIGVVAPLLTAELAMSPGQLGVVLAMTQIGAVLGALVLGKAADRFGRKPLIVLSLCLIGLFSAMTAFADGYDELLIVRFLTGAALTGVLPATLALVSELAPERRRGAVTALIVAGFPLGAAIGSLGGGAIAETAGWRPVFYLCAILPLLLAVATAFLLPESPRFLALTDNGGRRMAAALPRLVPGVDLARLWEPQPVEANDDLSRRPPAFAALFAKGLARPTLMLWIMLLCSGALSNVTLVWLPTLYATAGYSLGHAAAVVGALNIGATIGMASAGRVLDGFGARRTLGTAFVIATLAIAGVGLAQGPAAIVTGAILGLFLGMTTSAGYAIAAQIYPTGLRSTGVGGGAAALRMGTVLAPLVLPILIGLYLPLSATFMIVAVVPAVAACIAISFGRAKAHAA